MLASRRNNEGKGAGSFYMQLIGRRTLPLGEKAHRSINAAIITLTASWFLCDVVVCCAGGGGCGSPDGKKDCGAESKVPDLKKPRTEFSAVARVGGSVAKYKADQESA